jgi:hypothetical protein
MNVHRTIWLSFLLFAVLFLLSVPLGAATIISTDLGTVGCCYAILDAFNAEAGWSVTGTYDNVTITAEIDPGKGSGLSGTAYLMTQIGPGTTVADQIATAAFTAFGSAFTAQLNTLFTGLTLGPGDYFLVLSSPDGLGWEGAAAGSTPVTAPDVSVLSLNYTTSPAVYAPAGNFSNPSGNNPEFTVTGSPVPEPGNLALFCTALLGLGGTVKRKFFS